jgi:hypothetical protein
LGLPEAHTGKAMAEVPFCCVIECATSRCNRSHVTAISVRLPCCQEQRSDTRYDCSFHGTELVWEALSLT